ncbi:hypothetical protein niasHT_031516 [Heterodera trifolii]|uniref:Enoyl-CoA hydratase domain-containing protein 3, mitochondrial n=1 Tax=Heterodera trifolii TaxID=157864 RepID=A0ABD2HTJ2_9BILA
MSQAFGHQLLLRFPRPALFSLFASSSSKFCPLFRATAAFATDGAATKQQSTATAAQHQHQQHVQKVEQQQQQPSTTKTEWHLGNRVARLVMDDKRVNSLSLSAMEMLHDTLRELDARPEVRVVILAASGPAYSGGHHLPELTAESGTEMHQKVFNKCLELMTFIRQMQLPVIAEVDGIVAAAGTQLVAACDIVIASGRASFNVAGVKLGLFCATPAVPLSRNLPPKIALDMLLTGRCLEANIAHKFGLVSRLVGTAELRRETLAAAQHICDNSRAVVGMGKAFFYAQLEQNEHDAYRQATATMCDNLKWRDAQEGISAFFTRPRRQPQWTHTDQKVIKD